MASPGFNPLQACSWGCLPYTDIFGVSLRQPTGTLPAAPTVPGLSVVTNTRDANTDCWALEQSLKDKSVGRHRG